MLNYNFRDLLSAYEFECFSRDLINAHEHLDLASFAEGRDGGIDLRFSSNDGWTIIVQAKRYKDYQELKPVLNKEVAKVKSLHPHRYILTTSADLTASNKNEIIEWFYPFIQNENDILAKQDLNKLLGKHPEIEQKYYKLWLSSTSVLNSIINKNIVNWADFEKHEIEEAIKTYVMNDSFDDALQKLVRNHYVVISGEPGIGKTTLARIMIVHLLSDKYKDKLVSTNYEEFFYTNSNLEDFVRVFQEGKRQVFFYDDFLGQISLEEGERGFDKRIISFIKACMVAKDKLFILATREYILQQGLVRYPSFTQGKGIEMSKCVVDLGKYTRFVRAQILYNHLVANDIPQPYINAIIQDKNYLKIIDHPHFSPRIIQTFISNGTHEICQPEEYFSIVSSYFDHPDSVWLDAFTRLKDIAQEALLVLNTMPTPVMLGDWKAAYLHFFNGVHKEANYLKDQEWNEVVKVLQNNFIKTGKCPEGFFVEFHNPGVKEVLDRYIRDNEGMRMLLLNHIFYMDQFFGVFKDYRYYLKKRVIPPQYYDEMLRAFDKCWNNFRSCRIWVYKLSNNRQYFRRSPLPRIDALSSFKSDFSEALERDPLFVEKKISQDLMLDENYRLSSQLGLLQKIDLVESGLDIETLFTSYCCRLHSSDDCLDLAESMKAVFPDHLDYLDSDEFCSLVVGNLRQDLDDINDSGLEELRTTAEALCGYIPQLKNKPIIDKIDEAYQEYEDNMKYEAEAFQDGYRFGSNLQEKEDAWKIDDLFATIKE